METRRAALLGTQQERASLASVASVESQAFENIATKTTFVKEEITSSFASTSALQYKNAFIGEGSVDLRYTVSHNRVEEDIVINEKSDIRSYVMQITAHGLTVALGEDDSVSFFNENKDSIFSIGAPWMYDAADEFSIDIEVSLVQDGDFVTVVYTPNSTWLNAKERVYPVVIDPSVKSRNYTSNYVDAYVYTGSTVDDRILTLGYTKSGINSDGKEFETYTTFTSFPNLFAPMQIESATMTYYAALNRTGQRMRILNKQTDSVTAKNAGRVTLTATVKNSAGSVKNTYSYTVTLKLENGVYYIKNEDSGLYLDATGTSLAEGSDVVQSSKIETGDARFGQLWRIHYLGDNLYSIRSMRKLDMGLKAVNGNVALYTIGDTDTRTGISDTAEWNFKSSNSYGYRIQQFCRLMKMD